LWLFVELAKILWIVFKVVNIFIAIFLFMIGNLYFGILELGVSLFGNVTMLFMNLLQHK
jgi:hypothetical protein